MLVSALILYLQSKKQNQKVFVLSGKYEVKELELEDCVEFKNKVFLYKGIEELYGKKELELENNKKQQDRRQEEKDKLDN